MKEFDLTGQRFGPLTVIGRTAEQRSRSQWECRCVCGSVLICYTGNLRKAKGDTCSCSQRLSASKRKTSHNLNGTPEHRAWMEMRNRCFNPNNSSYPQYGGRGITVDPRWENFERFLADMGPKPTNLHSLDRIDNSGPYSPENCRWATRLEQANNKRNNRSLTFNGKTQTLAQWARETGLNQGMLERRLNKHMWSIEKVLTTPHRGWGRNSRKS